MSDRLSCSTPARQSIVATYRARAAACRERARRGSERTATLLEELATEYELRAREMADPPPPGGG